MPQTPTLVLASSIAWLYAVDWPIGVELPALAMVGLILRIFIRRDDNRFLRLEKEMIEVRAEASTQRHRAHLYDNRITGLHAALAIILPSARACTCDAMAPLIPVLEQLTAPVDEAA